MYILHIGDHLQFNMVESMIYLRTNIHRSQFREYIPEEESNNVYV